MRETGPEGQYADKNTPPRLWAIKMNKNTCAISGIA